MPKSGRPPRTPTSNGGGPSAPISNGGGPTAPISNVGGLKGAFPSVDESPDGAGSDSSEDARRTAVFSSVLVKTEHSSSEEESREFAPVRTKRRWGDYHLPLGFLSFTPKEEVKPDAKLLLWDRKSASSGQRKLRNGPANPLPPEALLQGRQRQRLEQRFRRVEGKKALAILECNARESAWTHRALSKVGTKAQRMRRQCSSFASESRKGTAKQRVADNLECYLSEANCRKFAERNPGLQKHKKYSIDDVDICQDLEQHQIKALMDLLAELADIFAKDDSEPKVMNPDLIAPVQFHLKASMENSEANCYKPSYGLHQQKLLRVYRERGVKQEFLSKSDSKFASRIHMTLKPGKDEIRFAWDCRKINELLAKLPPNLPNMVEQLQKQCGSRYFTSTDAAKGYHQLALTPETRKLLAVWMDDGLYEPNRLTEGAKNSGTHYQAAVNTALQSLQDEVRNATSNYLDDFLVGGADFETYLANTRAFFLMCRKFGITLHPRKTALGYDKAKMVGHEVGKIDGQYGKSRIHESNLKPLADALPPGNKQELQRFLGLCNYARSHVAGYSHIAHPLTKLTGNQPWTWGPTQQVAFEQLKEAVVKGFPLHIADYSRPFYLYSDASDFGMGAVLVQISGDDVKDQDLSKVPPERKQIVAFYSAAFDDAMARRPIYYREARAMIWSMGKAKRHLELSQHPIVMVTDHNPLLWIQATNRGTVTSWLLEEAAELDFRVVYIPGPKNSDADAVSRPPIVRPSVLNAVGTLEAWRVLLRMLPSQAADMKKTFVWAGPNTDNVVRLVQGWRSPKNPIHRAAPNSMHKHPKQDILLVCPDPEWSPVVAKQIIVERKDGIRACLVQSDLVNYIASADGEFSDICKTTVEKSSKIVFLGTNLTWLLFDDKGRNTVISTETVQQTEALELLPPPRSSLEGFATEIVQGSPFHGDNLRRWIEETEKDAAVIKKEYKGMTAIKGSGVTVVIADGPNAVARIYVPTILREGLVKETHKNSGHAWNMYPTLREKYIWPSMAADVNKWSHECDQCPPAKAKRNHAHGQFRLTDYIKPRVAYGVDFYAIERSDAGYVGVLTIVDLFTRYVQYVPVKDFRGDTAANALLKYVVLARGAPKTIVSDAAQAFVGKMVAGLCKLMKTKQVVTQYYPQGNALTERNHVLLGEALRLMPVDRRKTWEQEIDKVAYAANSTVNATTGFSPFELECGFTPNTPADLLFIEPPRERSAQLEAWAGEPEIYRGIVDGIRLYHDIARKYSEAKKLEMNKRLNRSGKGRQTFDIGDPVVVYVPASNESLKAKTKKGNGKKAPDMGWKPKHGLDWKYGTVVAKQGETTYVVKERFGTRRYTRSISCIQPDRAVHQRADVARVVRSNQVSQAVAADEDEVYAINDIVAVVEDYESSTFELGQIKEFVEEDGVKIHIFGTTNPDIRKAKFKPVFQDAQFRSFFHKESGSSPWIGTLNMEDIIMKIPKLGKDGALLANERTRLQKHVLYYLK